MYLQHLHLFCQGSAVSLTRGDSNKANGQAASLGEFVAQQVLASDNPAEAYKTGAGPQIPESGLVPSSQSRHATS